MAHECRAVQMLCSAGHWKECSFTQMGGPLVLPTPGMQLACSLLRSTEETTSVHYTPLSLSSEATTTTSPLAQSPLAQSPLK
ncbi:hypothetical protein DHEL01_v200068 [Diaporthe helianthi]|uniref:Uncharacterized protein n=1 Tax=Diaporthe helianthi TaxID=158607 RepID=A0A2P5IGF0_DIAHE|nr:hypothetical protein DHEL01_v200068 [Diaporthe helianthi]